jgi:hypothetical protein|tara:strand:+ start:328 stop:531 length:204 start_codon:yes stop_codon:yes gene_type:complete
MTTANINETDIMLELVSVALEGVLDDLNNVELSDRGAMALNIEMRLLSKAHKALEEQAALERLGGEA